ncbi:transglutaminase domain-containing protein, partial [Leucobacter sp. M11]|uniref:transglutaminase domain-containing protein n=1 Tax=Leucobacter sp. M11 TaxID=2993565 RepID=UPI002D8087A0
VAIAAGIAVAVVPLTADPGARLVPRDRIDPELVVRERPSPLSGYRSWFQDERFAEPLFEISAPDGGPDRLGLAVLGRYDGAEFHVGDPGASGERFTRFPSGETPRDPVAVEVTVASGYADIWVPLAADLSAPPRFGGPRADALTEGFYLNRGSGTGVAVPTAEGLRAGDTVTLTVPRAAPAPLSAGPASADPLLGLDAMPELSAWLRAQAQPRTAAGLTELIDRLGQRGYLSHALSVEADGALWLDDLRERGGGRFLPSYAGHSTARIEELFAQLNEQQRAAGQSAGDPALVAGIGDDEQFAAAAALLARALGYDSRVVVGVRLAGEDPASAALAVPPCAERCSGGNLAAWVEVRGDDDRWVALDASPQWQSVPTELNEGEQLPKYATVPRDLSASDAPPPLGLGEHDAPAATDSPEPGSDSALWPILRAAALSVAALLLLALPVLFLPVAKRL